MLPCEEDSMTVDAIRENPALGTGDPVAEGFADVPFDVKCSEGAGTVMNPGSAACWTFLLSFFFFVFSVLPLASGWGSRKSEA